MYDSILVIGEDARYRRKLLTLLCNVANVSMYSLESCDLIEAHLATHNESAILLQLGPTVFEDLNRINDANPRIPVALYGENVTYAETRAGFQHGVTDVLDIRNITLNEICRTIEHMLDPYVTGASFRLLPQETRFETLISRGNRFQQQLSGGMPPAFYMNGNRAMLLRANVRCRNDRSTCEHNVLLAWINEFGITNTFCFTKEYGQIRLGAIVEQDYVNLNAFRHALSERLERFFRSMEAQDCVACAAYISTDFLSEGVFQHLNDQVSSVFYLDSSQLLRDEIRSRFIEPTAALTALYSAVATRDVQACEAQLDGILESLRARMPRVGSTMGILVNILWNCIVIIGRRGHEEAQIPCVSIASLSDFRALFHALILGAMKGEPSDEPTSPLANVIERIKDNPGRSVSIDQIAQELNFSRSHFCRLFRKETGMSFNAFLTQARIAKACELFRHTHMSTGDVANLVGYSNTWYFKQTFQKEMNVDLDQWRADNCR